MTKNKLEIGYSRLIFSETSAIIILLWANRASKFEPLLSSGGNPVYILHCAEETGHPLQIFCYYYYHDRILFMTW